MILGRSDLLPGDQTERIRAFTRNIEFDYVTWTLDAIGLKIGQVALGEDAYLGDTARHDQVVEYLRLVNQIWQGEAAVRDDYADPNVTDPQAASAATRQELDRLYQRRDLLGPLAEGILQSQINTIAGEMGLTLGGQSIPPVLYHTTPPPYALIVSPRDAIRQDADISISPDLTVDQTGYPGRAGGPGTQRFLAGGGDRRHWLIPDDGRGDHRL